MTLEETSKVVMTMLGAFPNMKQQDMRPTIMAWHRTLGHLDGNIVEAAAYELLESAKFFPAPSEVLELARELLRDEPTPKQLQSGVSCAAAEQIAQIMRAAKNGDLSEIRRAKDVSQYLSFMRNFFEHISEETVRQNLPEIMHFKARTEYCLQCGGVGFCPDNHNQMEIEIMPAGWMRLTMMPCKYVVQQKAYKPTRRPRECD